MSESLARKNLLNLLASYFPEGPELVDRISADLALTRYGGFRLPKKNLLILFASRAGSNYLGQLLSCTGWFCEIGESFRPSQLAKVRNRHGLSDHHAAAQWMIDHRGTPHAFGFKAGFTVLIAAAELGVLSQLLDRAEILLLRRRDRLGQAISLVTSTLTGRTHSGQIVRRQITDDDYDSNAIAFQFKLIKERERQFKELVNRLGKQASVVYYEDICAAPSLHVARICESMGLPFPEDYQPDVRVQILRDDLSQRWAKRFQSDHSLLA